ncbi:MAG: response regulator [Anaerolineae bacterium]
MAEALRHLYDPSSLLRSPLIERLLPSENPTAGRGLPQRHGQRLRTLLLEAIESLSPGPRAAFRSLAARSYQAMHLHYVDGHTVDEVAHLLALSQRQAYRDIRKGEVDLAALLWQLHSAQAALSELKSVQSAGHLLRQEVHRLPLRPADISLGQALAHAAEPLAGLLAKGNIGLCLDLGQDYQVRADAAALHRFLVAALSLAVQACQGWPAGVARVQASARACDTGTDAGQVWLSLSGTPLTPGRLADLTNLLAVARALAESLGGAVMQFEADAQEAALRLRLPISLPACVMVIDDNEGLTELFRRYLGQAGYSVLEARNGSEGLRLARERHPKAILLDILMPDLDGWALLAQLKADPATMDIPVIVCSVFDDPGLAESLGAAAYIAKPVSKPALLLALQEAMERPGHVQRAGGPALMS